MQTLLFSLGSHPGGSDIHAYTDSFYNNGSSIIPSMAHGDELFTTVRCTNSKDLTATLTSASTVVIQGPPSSEAADLRPVIMDVSQYRHRDQHQGYNQQLRLGWMGFRDPAGISHYQVTAL